MLVLSHSLIISASRWIIQRLQVYDDNRWWIPQYQGTERRVSLCTMLASILPSSITSVVSADSEILVKSLETDFVVCLGRFLLPFVLGIGDNLFPIFITSSPIIDRCLLLTTERCVIIRTAWGANTPPYIYKFFRRSFFSNARLQ